VLATLGPASADAATIRALIAAGVDAVRLNFSHGTVDSHARTVALVRDAAAAAGRQIGILQDLSGPKVRIGDLATPLSLAEGDRLVIDYADLTEPGGGVPCNVEALFTSVPVGAHLLLDDGRIDVVVTEASAARLTTRVVAGGTLTSHKGINAPGVQLQMSAITAKDEVDLRAGVAMAVDMIAVSFVQSATDIADARRIAAADGVSDIPIFAKIERPGAVERIDEIVAAADGIIVARGDLGIELPLEQLPGAQRRIVDAARRQGKAVIIATQVLESMVHEARPTRAEVTDAAHAVDEGVDAIMLAGETAAGQHPVRAVETLVAIATEAERVADVAKKHPASSFGVAPHAAALAESAVHLAVHTGAAAIVAITEKGDTPRALAAYRPPMPILAVTPHARTAARLSLTWGVAPVVMDSASRPAIHAALVARGLIAPGATIVVVTLRRTVDGHGANMVQLVKV
jgi:pyruvate kinase